MPIEKTNLLNLSLLEMKAFFAEMGEKAFRASQVTKWLYQYGVDSFDQMTNLSKPLREKLSEIACISAPEIIEIQQAADGTVKWLLKLDQGNSIETVFIPEDNRGTLCVSSQVGCALDCSFCSTAQQGFNRNLTVAEIIGQLWVAHRELGGTPNDRKITNVVMMGMGEPLLNFNNVVKAMHLMMEDFSFCISKRRITLSTAGVVPTMDKLSDVCDVSLAVSLHAPTNELRDQLVPLNKKYPLEQLMEACKRYADTGPRNRITFEYVMLAGVNDSVEDARALLKLLKNVPSKVNLIPFNPFNGSDYACSSKNSINRFRNLLMEAGLITVTRKTRGDDIDAACGQLAGTVLDKTKRQYKNKVAVAGGT